MNPFRDTWWGCGGGGKRDPSFKGSKGGMLFFLFSSELAALKVLFNIANLASLLSSSTLVEKGWSKIGRGLEASVVTSKCLGAYANKTVAVALGPSCLSLQILKVSPFLGLNSFCIPEAGWGWGWGEEGFALGAPFRLLLAFSVKGIL